MQTHRPSYRCSLNHSVGCVMRQTTFQQSHTHHLLVRLSGNQLMFMETMNVSMRKTGSHSPLANLIYVKRQKSFGEYIISRLSLRGYVVLRLLESFRTLLMDWRKSHAPHVSSAPFWLQSFLTLNATSAAGPSSLKVLIVRSTWGSKTYNVCLTRVERRIPHICTQYIPQ